MAMKCPLGQRARRSNANAALQSSPWWGGGVGSRSVGRKRGCQSESDGSILSSCPPADSQGFVPKPRKSRLPRVWPQTGFGLGCPVNAPFAKPGQRDRCVKHALPLLPSRCIAAICAHCNSAPPLHFAAHACGANRCGKARSRPSATNGRGPKWWRNSNTGLNPAGRTTWPV